MCEKETLCADIKVYNNIDEIIDQNIINFKKGILKEDYINLRRRQIRI